MLQPILPTTHAACDAEIELIELAKLALPRDECLEDHSLLSKEEGLERSFATSLSAQFPDGAWHALGSLFAKYGPTTGADIPRRAITNKQSLVERALAASFCGDGRGSLYPFAERSGKTVAIEDKSDPHDGLEWKQQVQDDGPPAGARFGRPDSPDKYDDKPDGKLPLLGIFEEYLGESAWTLWGAIGKFTPKKASPNNPDPLAPVIWNVARSRIRHHLDKEPGHGIERYHSDVVKDDRSRRERIFDVLLAICPEVVAAADKGCQEWAASATNTDDVTVLRLLWPHASDDSRKPLRPSEIARRFEVNRSAIHRRVARIKREIPALAEALSAWKAISDYCNGHMEWQALSTKIGLAGIITEGDIAGLISVKHCDVVDIPNRMLAQGRISQSEFLTLRRFLLLLETASPSSIPSLVGSTFVITEGEFVPAGSQLVDDLPRVLMIRLRVKPLKIELGRDFWRLEQIVRPWWPHVVIPANLNQIIAKVEAFFEAEQIEHEEIVPPYDPVDPLKSDREPVIAGPAYDPFWRCERHVWLKTGAYVKWKKCQHAAERSTLEWRPSQPAGYPIFRGKLVAAGKCKRWAVEDIQDFHSKPFDRFLATKTRWRWATQDVRIF